MASIVAELQSEVDGEPKCTKVPARLPKDETVIWCANSLGNPAKFYHRYGMSPRLIAVQVNELCSMFFNFTGTLQRDAPKVELKC